MRYYGAMPSGRLGLVHRLHIMGSSLLLCLLIGVPTVWGERTAHEVISAAPPDPTTPTATAEPWIQWTALQVTTSVNLALHDGVLSKVDGLICLAGELRGLDRSLLAIGRVVVEEALDDRDQPIPINPLYLPGEEAERADRAMFDRKFTFYDHQIALWFHDIPLQIQSFRSLRGYLVVYVAEELQAIERPIAAHEPELLAPGFSLALTRLSEEVSTPWQVDLVLEATEKPSIHQLPYVMHVDRHDGGLSSVYLWQPVPGKPHHWRNQYTFNAWGRESSESIRFMLITRTRQHLVPFHLQNLPLR